MDNWTIFWIILGVVFLLAIVVLAISYYCFCKVFFVNRKEKDDREYPLPKGEIYEPYYEQMISWIEETRAMPQKEVEITTFDGLTLRGRYFEYAPNAPIELMLHGYRGQSECDLSGGVLRAFAHEKSVLMFDHRGCGKSDGNVVTFGINESKDCKLWINYILENINPNAKIILTGISMGAATVMICSSQELPKNVIGVIADCGFTSAKDIIQKVMKDTGYPPKLFYPFVKLGAKLFGHFDLEEVSPIESMKNCKLPIIFFHGDKDDFVPYEMSKRNYGACTSSSKRFVTIEGAGHGLAYPADQQKYIDELKDFFTPFL